MKFTNIRDLKYSKADNSTIDLFATCEEYGEIPMTLILTDTEDLHTFFDGKTEYPLEEYCKTQKIQEYIELKPTEVQLQEQVNAEARAKLGSLDWRVIRELERLMLGGTELNLEREALRASIV